MITSYFKNKFTIEFYLFISMFVLVFPMLSFYTNSGSDNNVEQWINLTNQMFYGSQDLTFSYGPMFWITGSATSAYTLKTYLIAKLFISLVYAYFWTIIFSLVYRYKALLFFAILFILFFKSLLFSGAFYLWPLVTLYYLQCSQEQPVKLNSKAIVVIGLITGSFFYIRYFYGLISLLLFGSYFFSLLFFEKKDKALLYFISSTVIGYIGAGLIIFHNYRNIINYHIINSQLSFGNSVDMTLNIGNTAACFIAISLAFIAINIHLWIEKKILLLPVNLAFMLLFKIGFSRADHYLVYFVIPIFIVSIVMLLSKKKVAKYLFVIFLLSIGYVAAYPAKEGDFGNKLYKITTIDFHSVFADRMATAYEQYKLDKASLDLIGRDSIDVYPYNNEYMFANKLNYKFRPNFQNYMTLTPILDQMNKVFFESNQKPGFILWTAGSPCWGNPLKCNFFDDFDEKYILNEDPLTSISILENYHIVKRLKGKNDIPLMLLKKNILNSKITKVYIKSEKMRIGEWYDVPIVNTGIVKLIPTMELTLTGRLKNLFFRGDILYINYKFSNGEIKRYRLNILNSISGIWISPYFVDFEFNGLKVEKIMLETSGLHYFKPAFRSEWINFLMINNVTTVKN